jgi:CpXC protein
MPKTRINCPNCRQPITADVDQLFDVAEDPTMKSKLLAGAFNLVRCPNCGYQGNLATPIVYHDPDKELLLTYFPPEVGLPRDEQERLIGSMINQVVNRLPQEKRKAYLLRPQSVLTMQGLIERILEADGITREMIQAQQQKLNLLTQLLGATPEARADLIRGQEDLIDADFFSLMSRLSQASLANGDQQSANKIADIQKELLSSTAFGRQVQDQAKEVEAAIASLREAGDNLTREKLLDLCMNAPNDVRLSVLVSLTRPGMDYAFFQLLSERIDRARGDGRTRLIALRERLLDLTREVDQQTEARMVEAQQILNGILQAPDVERATVDALPAIDELFIQVLKSRIDEARKQADLDKISKLQKVEAIIEQASTPPEVAFLEELIEAGDEQTRRRLLEGNPDKVTPEFLDTLTNIVAQVETSEDKQLAEQIKAIHRMALRYSMEANLRQ